MASNRTIAQFLADPDSYATVLLAILIDCYGTEAVGWDPSTIRLELQDDFQLQLPQVNFDKLMAAISVLTSDEFYQRLSRFIPICNVMSGSEYTPGLFDPADAYECAWGLTEAMLISPPESDEPFADDIRRYIGKVLDEEGIKAAPDLLQIAIRDTSTGAIDYSGMSSDPSLFQAEFQVQADRGQQIQQQIRENLQELFEQLASLPLKNGDTSGLAEKARKHLAQA